MSTRTVLLIGLCLCGSAVLQFTEHYTSLTVALDGVGAASQSQRDSGKPLVKPLVGARDAMHGKVALLLVAAIWRWPTWDKLPAAKAVLQHSGAEWLWMADADSFIMNMNIPISDVIKAAVQQSFTARGSIPDVIVAEDCLIPLNSGSMIFHNSPWTQQHLSDVWHSNDNCNGFTDNGAFLELWKLREVQQHYWKVSQRALNAYPELQPGTGNRACPNGTYEEGDLLVHFPGNFKPALPAFMQNVTNALFNTKRRARHSSWRHLMHPKQTSAVPSFAVYDAHLRGNTDAAHTLAIKHQAGLVDVSMVSTSQQGISTVLKSAVVTLSIQPRAMTHHSHNPGWPVAALRGFAGHHGVVRQSEDSAPYSDINH